MFFVHRELLKQHLPQLDAHFEDLGVEVGFLLLIDYVHIIFNLTHTICRLMYMLFNGIQHYFFMHYHSILSFEFG
jgi:hypothetical protein